jgi:hypothetical protein
MQSYRLLKQMIHIVTIRHEGVDFRPELSLQISANKKLQIASKIFNCLSTPTKYS